MNLVLAGLLESSRCLVAKGVGLGGKETVYQGEAEVPAGAGPPLIRSRQEVGKSSEGCWPTLQTSARSVRSVLHWDTLQVVLRAFMEELKFWGSPQVSVLEVLLRPPRESGRDPCGDMELCDKWLSFHWGHSCLGAQMGLGEAPGSLHWCQLGWLVVGQPLCWALPEELSLSGFLGWKTSSLCKSWGWA